METHPAFSDLSFHFLQQLAEGREKYMKSLEMELRKLQTANTDATNHFDERLNQLFIKKIKTEAVILQVRFSIKRISILCSFAICGSVV